MCMLTESRSTKVPTRHGFPPRAPSVETDSSPVPAPAGVGSDRMPKGVAACASKLDVNPMLTKLENDQVSADSKYDASDVTPHLH